MIAKDYNQFFSMPRVGIFLTLRVGELVHKPTLVHTPKTIIDFDPVPIVGIFLTPRLKSMYHT